MYFINQIKKNPATSEEHFLKLHTTEKQYELSRFDYYSVLSNACLSGKLLAVEQSLSLVFTQWVSFTQSFTNTALEKFKAKQSDINKLSERIQQSKKGLISIQDSLKKEREIEEMKINVFVRNPQFKDSKSGYLWKQGNILKEWKRRYFFINNSQLVYLRGALEIVYVSLMMSKTKELPEFEHLFALEVLSVSPHSKVVLIAESDAEVKEWVHALRKCSEQGLLGYSESEYACADCLTASPEWCSINLGVLLCTACSGIHRSLGTHVSKVRSLLLDTIDPALKKVIYCLHENHQGIWGEGFRPPRFCENEEKEEYMRSRYQHKAWVKKIDNPNQALTTAIKENDGVKVFVALLSGAKVNETGMLHLAAKYGAIDAVVLLISAGWEVEAKNSDAFTPLEVALLAGHNEVVEYIVRVINA